ncbi:DUF3991 and toprim domain-containing protein [Lacrimispora sp.]|uniref:DUF3991 and toprim domain-containing protein n=1 Tax=Lacrimispora sp. TaxID=2719234 RepID=UPI0028AF7543|nr:DUF3991 and toprim domain-containing protein [Lacrimispora sp.]
MGVYVHFTDEQKYRANNVDLVDFLQKQHEELLPSGRDKRLASDHSITVQGNRWYDHSAESGGYAIDFVQKFYGLRFSEAVTMLLGGEQGKAYPPALKEKQEPKHPFALPTPHSDMRRVYAYLVKTRLIDREVVNYFAKKKLLYESCEKSKDGVKEYHNAVFVGYDENGVPRHAHKRGLITQGTGFKGNVDSCDPAYSFHYVGAGNSLYVFEAPIDLLSYIALHSQNWQNHSYVALCGVSEYAMLKMLEMHPHLIHVVLCLDHDEAGIEAAEKYQDLLSEKGISCEREISVYKDWNEDIKANHGLPAVPAEEHPQHLLRDEICQQLMESLKTARSECSADTLSAMLTKARSYLHWGQFSEMGDCLREMCCLSVAAAVREYRQMDHIKNATSVQTKLINGFRVYENRGHLKTRLDLLESDIMALQSHERVRTIGEKENLAEFYERIAAQSLKGEILLEKHRQKIEKKLEVKLSM